MMITKLITYVIMLLFGLIIGTLENFIILSDRGVNENTAPLPMLLAVGAVHHYLIKKALRTKIGIIVESAEPREVHHFALSRLKLILHVIHN